MTYKTVLDVFFSFLSQSLSLSLSPSQEYSTIPTQNEIFKSKKCMKSAGPRRTTLTGDGGSLCRSIDTHSFSRINKKISTNEKKEK